MLWCNSKLERVVGLETQELDPWGRSQLGGE